MKFVAKIVNLLLFSAWLLIGGISIKFIIDKIRSPELSGVATGMTILLVVWSAFWIFGGLYAMRYHLRKQAEQLSFYQSYHHPERLKYRDLLRHLKGANQEVAKLIFLTIVVLCYFFFFSEAKFNPFFLFLPIGLIFNYLDTKRVKRSLRKLNDERKSSLRSL